jgi:hypothetical protein
MYHCFSCLWSFRIMIHLSSWGISWRYSALTENWNTPIGRVVGEWWILTSGRLTFVSLSETVDIRSEIWLLRRLHHHQWPFCPSGHWPPLILIHNRILWHTVGVPGWVISPSQDLHLHRAIQHRTTKDKHPCHVRDSNPGSSVRAIKVHTSDCTATGSALNLSTWYNSREMKRCIKRK